MVVLGPFDEGSGHKFLRNLWRRGESNYAGVLKTQNLLKNRHARNTENAEIAPNWYVSGTRLFEGSILKRRQSAKKKAD
jgi:hypothetical protein